MPEAFGHQKVGVSGAYLEPGWVYHGGALKSSSAGAATVDIYDGIDTTGDPVDAFQCALSSRDVHVLERGLIVRRRLYVSLGSNVSFFTLYFTTPGAREKEESE